MNREENNLNPIFVPYDLPIENIKTLQKAIWDEITSYPIPPYSLTVDKDKVPEMNLAPPDKDKLFYMEFNNYKSMSLKRLDFDNNKEICRTCMFIDEYALNINGEGEIPHGHDGTAMCGIHDEEKDDNDGRGWFISPYWKACSKYKRCTERQADYLDIFDLKTNSIIENPHKI